CFLHVLCAARAQTSVPRARPRSGDAGTIHREERPRLLDRGPTSTGGRASGHSHELSTAGHCRRLVTFSLAGPLSHGPGSPLKITSKFHLTLAMPCRVATISPSHFPAPSC